MIAALLLSLQCACRLVFGSTTNPNGMHQEVGFRNDTIEMVQFTTMLDMLKILHAQCENIAKNLI